MQNTSLQIITTVQYYQERECHAYVKALMKSPVIRCCEDFQMRARVKGRDVLYDVPVNSKRLKAWKSGCDKRAEICDVVVLQVDLPQHVLRIKRARNTKINKKTTKTTYIYTHTPIHVC